MIQGSNNVIIPLHLLAWTFAGLAFVVRLLEEGQ